MSKKCILGTCKLVKKISDSTAGFRLKVSHKSPEILMITGIIGVVGSTILACRSTLKIDEVLDQTAYSLDKIKEGRATYDLDVYSETDYKKDLAITYAQTAVGIVKLYALPVAGMTLSLSLIIKSNGILRKRNMALVAAYTAVDTAFKEYRQRVVSELGEDKDRHFRFGTEKEKFSEIVVGEDGKNKTVKGTIETVPDGNRRSMYAVDYSKETSKFWSDYRETNIINLNNWERYANEILYVRAVGNKNGIGHFFLHEVYDCLGIERTEASCVVGWTATVEECKNRQVISFGMFENDSQEYENFVMSRVPYIELDFNVDGVIFDDKRIFK